MKKKKERNKLGNTCPNIFIIFITAIPAEIGEKNFPLFQQSRCRFLFFFSFFHIYGNGIAEIGGKKFSPLFRQSHCRVLSFLFFFSFFFFSFTAMVFPIFFSPYFGNAIVSSSLSLLFFSLFRQCHCHN